MVSQILAQHPAPTRRDVMRVLHVIPRMSVGGASLSLASLIAATRQQGTEDRVLSLAPPASAGSALLGASETPLIDGAGSADLTGEIAQADIVALSFWNTPETMRFLSTVAVPRRLLLWSKVFGRHPPQVFTPFLMDQTDALVVTSPSSGRLAVVEDAARRRPELIISCVPSFMEAGRVRPVPRSGNSGFTIGYIGTVAYEKIHAGFARMAASVNVPDLRVIVCGVGDAEQDIAAEGRRRGRPDLFDMRGFIRDVAPVLSELDVFAYPLCGDTYATSEKSLQEAMLAGVPPVVFAHGGIVDIVEDGVTGLVVDSEEGFVAAIERLHADPNERARLSANARKAAKIRFRPEPLVDRMIGIYRQLMTMDKRTPPEGADLADPGGHPALRRDGARSFLGSLGDAGDVFRRSVAGTDGERSDCIAGIAAASPVLVTAPGGILDYRSHYPDDACLRFWSGIVLAARGRHALAVAELKRAIDLGVDLPEAHGLVAESASRIGAHDLARMAASRAGTPAAAVGPHGEVAT